MSKSMFSKTLSHSCEFCKFGKNSVIKGEILCKKHGVTKTRDKCSSYKYDVFKRIPKDEKALNNFKAEDFEL